MVGGDKASAQVGFKAGWAVVCRIWCSRIQDWIGSVHVGINCQIDRPL